MSWFWNGRQDRDMLELVLGMVEDVSIPVETKEWTMVTKHRGHVAREPQLVHDFGTFSVRRPEPFLLNMGPHEVVIGSLTIVPNRIWRSRFSAAMKRRERTLAARALTASIRARAGAPTMADGASGQKRIAS
jgi:hypothetical protein